MEFPSRKAIMKESATEGGGRKRLRGGSSTGAIPPTKVLAPDATGKAPSLEVLRAVVSEGTTVPSPASKLPVIPTEGTAGKGPADQIISASDRIQIESEPDLELSLRQKKDHDVNASENIKSTEKKVDIPDISKNIDMNARFEFRARNDRGKCGTSTSAERRRVEDTVSSSGTETFGFINVPSDSGLKVSDSGNHVEVNKTSQIPPANQDMTFYESAEMHGIDMNTGTLQRVTEKRVEDDQPNTILLPPPQGLSGLALEGPGESSLPAPHLSQGQICEKILHGVEEIKEMLQQLDDVEEMKRMLQGLVDAQSTLGASTGLAEGVVTDLRNYMSRIPSRATMNVTFCGLMVAARLGHLTPFIFEDPVILCLLGDHAEDVRQMIANSFPYPYSFRGSQ